MRPQTVRFGFGENWRRFLEHLTEERIEQAQDDFRAMLEVDDLSGRTFLDVGCGSGLSSLAAMRLGADRVHSFDFDPESVACAEELRAEEHLRASVSLLNAYVTYVLLERDLQGDVRK